MRSLAVLTLLVLAATPAKAQETEALLWLSADADVALGSATELGLESEFRFDDSGHEESILGFMLSHEVGGVSLGAGYQHSRSVGGPAVREHRLRQQVAFPITRVAGGTLRGQLRLEERIRNDCDDVHFRLRPQIAYSLPLNRDGTRLSIAHESFVGTSADWNRQRGLFRMRNSIAVAAPLVGRMRGSVGYLNQYGFGRDGARDRMAHVVTAGIALGF